MSGSGAPLPVEHGCQARFAYDNRHSPEEAIRERNGARVLLGPFGHPGGHPTEATTRALPVGGLNHCKLSISNQPTRAFGKRAYFRNKGLFVSSFPFPDGFSKGVIYFRFGVRMRNFPGSSEPRKLERDLNNRRLGGVCSGLARYLGVPVTAVRFVFLVSIFLSFSFTFWLYLVLWALLPARRSPVSKLSWRLRWKARRINKLVDATRARLRLPEAQSALDHTHELILGLLPDFERRSSRDQPELVTARKASLEDLPAMLDHYLRLPHGHAVGQGLASGLTAEERLGEELVRLETMLHRITERRFCQQLQETAGSLSASGEATYDEDLLPVRQKLDSLQRRIAGQVDIEVERKLAAIGEALLTLLSRLDKRADAADPDLYDVRRIAFEYLPDALEKYLALPPDLARSEPLPHGKTAHAVLSEQLDVLDQSLRRILTSLYRDDAQGLLIHGRFLRDKFVEHRVEWLE
jgi:phage shock protein PspC (stress-responsive transcriptional regulator)